MNGNYDPALVIAAFTLAVCAAYAALDLGARIAIFDGARERLWLGAGSLAVGTGFWAMHFTGIAARKLPSGLSFDFSLTALAWVVAVTISFMALFLVSRSTLTRGTLGAAALAMGTGLSLVHFLGLWAMGLQPAIHYDPLLAAASFGAAVAASAAALFICFSLRRPPETGVGPAKAGAALAMGAAFFGAHFIGMVASRVPAGAVCDARNLLAGSWMGLPVALFTIGLLAALLLLSLMDVRAMAERRRVERKRMEAERVRRLAYFDAATGLPNRSQFNERLLRHLIAVNGKAPPPFGLVYGELRGYRALVEKHGQDRVNLMMAPLVRQLSRLLREGDTLARLSHDGFVFLLREHSDRSLEDALHQAAALFGAPVQSETQSFRLAWGLGSSRYPEHGNSTQSLIRAAMKLQREVGSDGRSFMQQTVSAMGAA